MNNTRHRPSKKIHLGSVAVGGGAPITVQSMTNTKTQDATATLKQIESLVEAGADLVRVSCPDPESTYALKEIVAHSAVPIIADIHFHYKRAIEAAQAGAACLRLNPGNIGSKERVQQVVQAAKDHGCAMRIGVNAGSLEPDLLKKYHEPTALALVESALRHAAILESFDFFNFKLSVKASNVPLMIEAYQQLAAACNYPLHLGVTEAGGLKTGSVKSVLGIGALLAQGIGDTIRCSLAADPVEEIKLGIEILKALGHIHKGVTIIACPSCARQGFDVISTVNALENLLSHIQTPITISIIGCVVNGPGEAQKTHIGITGGGQDQHAVYMDGKLSHRIPSDALIAHVVELVENYAKQKVTLL